MLFGKVQFLFDLFNFLGNRVSDYCEGTVKVYSHMFHFSILSAQDYHHIISRNNKLFYLTLAKLSINLLKTFQGYESVLQSRFWSMSGCLVGQGYGQGHGQSLELQPIFKFLSCSKSDTNGRYRADTGHLEPLCLIAKEGNIFCHACPEKGNKS